VRARDRGSVTAWMMLVPLLVAVLGGFSLDLWAALGTRGRVAAIADEAAAAGATALDVAGIRAAGEVQIDPAAAHARAAAAVDGHPDAGLLTGREVVATPDRVAVTVTARHEFLLLRLVGATAAAVEVTGHARPVVLE
jgi:Flp pilus assembly protein TadG